MKKGNVVTRDYLHLVRDISDDIRLSRYVAARSVNQESLLLYFRTGKTLETRIKSTDWGDAVLEMISAGIQKIFPGIRGFSIRNLYNMRQFYDSYASLQFLQSTTAKIGTNKNDQHETGRFMQTSKLLAVNAKNADNEQAFLSIGFTHHILLLQKCPDIDERFFYIRQAAHNQWSVEVLRYHIDSNLYRKKGGIASSLSAPAIRKSNFQ